MRLLAEYSTAGPDVIAVRPMARAIAPPVRAISAASYRLTDSLENIMVC